MKRRAVPYIVLSLLTLLVCWLFVGRYGVFGAKIDWISQHSVLPDYFRQRFYETGQLFPEFAPNLGGGQNIYNFSYYGLYSPVIWLSYLLPFVRMDDYIMASAIGLLAAAVCLLYKWLCTRQFNAGISFGTAVLFLLAAPMLFQSYNQLMFVNYMPFLCLALMGVDRFLENERAGLYTFSVFLMILTSFYFSIGGMAVLVLYGVFRYFEIHTQAGKKITAKLFLTDGIRFLMPMLTAVLMSGVLLIPTAMTLLAARAGSPSGGGQTGNAGSTLAGLLIPKLHPLWICYHPYGIGLTTFAVTVIIGGCFYKKGYEKILSAGCMTALMVPLIVYVLNGGLYVRDKALIPFLPLICYMTAEYVRKLERKEIRFRTGVISFAMTVVIIVLLRKQPDMREYWKLFLLDALVMLICFVVCCGKNKAWMLIAVSTVFLAVYGSSLHKTADRMVDKTFYREVTDPEIQTAVKELLDTDNSFFRVEQSGNASEAAADLNRIWDMRQWITSVYSSSYHGGYAAFRKETFHLEEPFRNFLMESAAQNPIYRELMGVKYIISKEDVPGYTFVKRIGNQNIYRSETAAPVAYATDRIISGEAYKTLEFPYNQTALEKYAAVEKLPENPVRKDADRKALEQKAVQEDWLKELKEETVPVLLEFPCGFPGGEKTENGYHFMLAKAKQAKVPVPPQTGMMFVQFQVKNNHPNEDVSVTIAGVKNKLSAANHTYYNGNTTFTYAVSVKSGCDEVKVAFGAGDYEITDVRAFRRKALTPEEETTGLYQSVFQKERTKNANQICGAIRAEKDGYFITSIPYDAHMEVRVDGQLTKGEKVNTAFLGFPITAGDHRIEITCHAPGVMAGKICSLIGILLFFGRTASLISRKHIRSEK